MPRSYRCWKRDGASQVGAPEPALPGRSRQCRSSGTDFGMENTLCVRDWDAVAGDWYFKQRQNGGCSARPTSIAITTRCLHPVRSARTLREWDVLLESRRLTVHEADQDRSGLLAAVYRHVSTHVKIGAGYNFTDFSDDLTDLSYRSRGPFLNVLSTFQAVGKRVSRRLTTRRTTSLF
jgi:hypothetical protein